MRDFLMKPACTTTLKLFMVFTLLAAASTAHAAEWGSIKGRFVVDGAPPAVPPLKVDKDQFCIDNKPHNDTIVVGKDGSLANAVVYLFLGRRGKVEVHPDYATLSKEPVSLDNKGCSFKPHVVTVRTGQPLVIKNSDPVGHNTNATNLFNETIAAGEERPKTFDKPQTLPVPVSCGIHPFMKGHLLIQEHPYMAVSAEDGTFEIKNIPAGKHDFQFWHETGYLSNVKLSSGTTDRRGRVNLTIKPGETIDLGVIKVPASLLK
jgi:plastocyanin